MLRFLALIGDPAEPHETESYSRVRQLAHGDASHLEAVLDMPGLYVAVASEAQARQPPIVLGPGTGVVLGTIFKSVRGHRRGLAEACPVRKIGATQSEHILQTGGRSMIDAYWGSYVLIIRESGGNQTHVLRGPMSLLPCFHAQYKNTHLLFSNVADLARLGLVTLTINWQCVRAQATTGDYLTHETGLNEISTLEPGECFRFQGPTQKRIAYWTPATHARHEAITDFVDASEQLGRCTRQSVAAWASCHDKVLCTLSGGIDSSIVLAGLYTAPARPEVTCITYYSSGRLGDERGYARSMADKCGYRLIEMPYGSNVDLGVFFDCAPTVQPVRSFTAFDCHPRQMELARQLKATAIFNGELGDNVFGCGVGDLAMADLLSDAKSIRRTLGAALNIAHLQKESFWSVIRKGICDCRSMRSLGSWSACDVSIQHFEDNIAGCSVVSDEVVHDYVANRSRFVHPWLRDTEGVPFSRQPMIYGMLLMTSTAYHQPFAKSADVPYVSPLASQPLVETALRISSDLHIRNGQDRAVARHAFKEHLSDPVFRRGGKGRPDSWIQEVISANTDILRESLLTGILAREGIVDRRKVESALSNEITRSSIVRCDLLTKLYIEAWLRQWAGRRVAPRAM